MPMERPDKYPKEPMWPTEELDALDAMGYASLSYRTNLRDTVRRLIDADGSAWYVKKLPASSQELQIWKLLLESEETRGYVMPATFHPCGEVEFAISRRALMCYGPCRMKNMDTVFMAARRILAGLTRMHDIGIAHFDVHLENTVYYDPQWTPFTPEQKHDIFLLIDYGSSRLVSSPPGTKPPALTDFRERDGGHWPPPGGMGNIDPYAYDVYCAGMTLAQSPWFIDHERKTVATVSFSWWMFCKMLAREKPEGRPTMRRAALLGRCCEAWIRLTRWMYFVWPQEKAQYCDALGWLTLLRFACVAGLRMARKQRAEIVEFGSLAL